MLTASDIAGLRLRNLLLSGPAAAAEDVVRRLGAVQAQDYGPAKWSVGQRTTTCTDADLDRAVAAGTILRTHLLRPTWHFVLPEDVRWLLELTAPRIRRLTAARNRQLGLDDALLATCGRLIAEAVQDGRHRTRRELDDTLKGAGIVVGDGVRLSHILVRAELDALVCSGAPKGKQQTYALLDERAPQRPPLSRDEALAELTRRYFAGHGPATAGDFQAWSTLTAADVKRGIAAVSSQLAHEVVDGLTFWFAARDEAARDEAARHSAARGGAARGGPAAPPARPSPIVHLLQAFDELVMGYSESRYMLDLAGAAPALPPSRVVFNHVVLLDGQLAGRWMRTVQRGAVVVEAALDRPFDDAQSHALAAAAREYGAFLGLPASVVVR